MIDWYCLRYPTFITAQESTLVQNVTYFVSEVPNLICIADNLLLGSNGIGLVLIVAEHLNIPAEITNNGCLFQLS